MIFTPNVVKWWQTVNLNLGVFVVGLSIAIFGVGVIDLSEVFDAPVTEIVYVHSSRSVGAIVACFFGGYVYSKFNCQIVMLLATLLGGISLAVVPICPSLFWSHFACFLVGISIGGIEVGSNVWLITLWKERGPSVLQFYHFVFGVGAAIAPLMTEPFLSVKHDEIASNSSDIVNTTSGIQATSESRIFIPFMLFGGMYIVTAVFMLSAYFVNSDDVQQQKDNNNNERKISLRMEYIIVAGICVYVLIGVASEQTYSSLIAVYAVKYLGFKKSAAAYLVSVFWCCFTLSRVVTTVLSLSVKSVTLLIGSHIIMMVSSTLLLLFPQTTWIIWTMTGVFAFGLSPFFGNVCGWALEYIFLSHNYMAAIVMSVCVGAMLPPITIGPFIEQWPMVFMYSNFAIAALMTVWTIGLVLLGRRCSKSSKKVQDNKTYEAVRSAESDL